MFTENDQAEQHSSTHEMQMLHMHVNIYMSSDTFFRAGENTSLDIQLSFKLNFF